MSTYRHHPCQRSRFAVVTGNTTPIGDKGACLPPTALSMAPTHPPIPKPLSRIQLVIVRLPTPPDPAVAASAPRSPQSTTPPGLRIVKKPRKVRHQSEAGTNTTFATMRKVK